jgi:tetratricopeptide (TPR) repeat protein
MEARFMDADRKYVLFAAKAVDLGHLLTALMNSAYYAYRTNRILALDMREFLYASGDRHAAFFEHFALELPHDLGVITELDAIDRLRRDDDLHFLQAETERLIVEQSFTERVLLIPCLVPGRPYEGVANRKDLPFRVGLRGKLLEAWRAAMSRPEWSGPVIGLHYSSTMGAIADRMTKALAPDYDDRYRQVKDRYIAAALQVVEAAVCTNPAFFVTGDDTEFVSYVKERLPNSFSLAARLPDQELAAWVRAHGHDFGILSDAVNDLWCLSACDHFIHCRSDFSNFAILNSTKLDETNTHYLHVPALKEILDSLGLEEAVVLAGSAARKADIRRIQLYDLRESLADALDRVGQTDAAAHERRRARWDWECHHTPVTDNPDNAQVEGRAQRGDFSGVLGVAQRAVEEMPGNPYWLAGYGGSLSNILAQMGRWQEAIPPAQQALEIVPEDPFLHEHFGFVLTGAGALQEGEQAIRQAIAIDAEVGRFHTALGDCLMRQGRDAAAVEAFREAVRLEPDDTRPLRRLGAALTASDDYAAAEAAFRQALDLRSEAGVHIDLYNCFMRQRRMAEAIAEAQAAVALEPANPHWHYRVALSLLHAERLVEAEAAARTAEDAARAAIGNGPGLGVFCDLLAQILQRQGRSDESIAFAQRAAELKPQDPLGQLRLARALLEGKQLAAAEAAARRAAALQPDLVDAHDLLSVIAERLSNAADAVAAAQRAADLRPQDSDRQYRLALVLFQSGDWTGTAQALREERRLAPGPSTFHRHHLLGIVFERQGRIEEAITEARTASDLEPEDANLLARVAVLLRMANRIDEAGIVARKAVSMKPTAEPFQRLLTDIIEQCPEPEPAPANTPPTEVLAREAEPALPTRERTQQQPARSPRRQWLSGTSLSWPLRQMFTGKPKRDA